MDKVAVFKGKEIAREKAIEPYDTDGKFNVIELSQFYNKVSRNLSYNNSVKVEYHCFYQK